jgi:RecA-family ATPase
MGIIKAKLAANPDVVLVLVDPLYLAAKGARGASLYDMATVLEPLQLLCQNADCALVLVHHWNQTGKGTGAERMSGAGPFEWAARPARRMAHHSGGSRTARHVT